MQKIAMVEKDPFEQYKDDLFEEYDTFGNTTTQEG